MRVIEILDESPLNLKTGLALSLIIHSVFIYLLIQAPTRKLPIELSLDVAIVHELPPEPEIPTRQIVDTPENSQEESNSQARLLSDKNVSTEKEQIKRGDRPDAAPRIGGQRPQSPSAAISRPPVRKEPPVKELPPKKLTTLKLDDETLLQKFSGPQKSQPKSIKPQEEGYKAFSRPQGSGAAFIGLSGSSDYLPHLPDGDITLLNTKADKFAVFVRRVASLVFSHMRNTGWERLEPSDINRIQDYTTIRAVLDPQGNLIRITLEGASGSPRFDEALKTAVNKGAHDPNPPREALADDGNFHFIFKSKCWSMQGNAPKTGAPFERRWLLLATGLL